jgi:hypothetical protein
MTNLIEELLPVAPKRRYQAPELIVWGSIVDLTQGKRAGLQDLPFKGGTQPV